MLLQCIMVFHCILNKILPWPTATIWVTSKVSPCTTHLLSPIPPNLSSHSLSQICQIHFYLKVFLTLLFPQHGTLFLQFSCVSALLQHDWGLQEGLLSLTLLYFIYSSHLNVSLKLSCFICLLVHCRLPLEHNLYYSNTLIVFYGLYSQLLGQGQVYCRHSIHILNEWMTP